MPNLAVTGEDRRAYPTYNAAKKVVNGDLSAPIEFFGWTVLRSLILIPGLALGGVRGWKLVSGALAGSTMVSLFALYRTYATKQAQKRLTGAPRRRPRRLPPPRVRRRRR